MQLFENLENIHKPFHNTVVTIGNFDGVHIGHQALFHETIEKAAEIGGTSVAMTFEPHPLRMLKKDNHPPLITLYEQKKELIERSGIDVLVCIPFTKEFAAISADEFVGNILVRKMGLKAIVVGKDFTFARKREGDIDFLHSRSEHFGYEVLVPDWIQTSGSISSRISSTRIRKLVEKGEMNKAQQLLGRYYQIRGTVGNGRNRGGKLLGFPTANIRLYDELCPKTGIYAVIVEVDNRRLKGVANIGFSPTFDDHKFTVEVHILDFDEDIYGCKIKVHFLQRIRDEKKFETLEQLSEQIGRDVQTSRKILNNHS